MRATTTLTLAVWTVAILTLASVTVLFISAGLLVQQASGIDVHGAGAIAIHVFSGLLALLLAVRAGKTRVGLLPAVMAAVLFGFTVAQAALGDYATMAWHIAGALIVTVLAAWLTFWSFTSAGTAAPASPAS